MKKTLLSILTVGMCLSGIAQEFKKGNKSRDQIMPTPTLTKDVIAAKTTADGDTIYGLLNFSSTQLSGDSLVCYTAGADSGFIYGPNIYGDKAWAERFDFDGADSSIEVIGTYALFYGSVSSTANTHAINFNVWSQGPISLVSGTTNIYWGGFPNTILTTSQNFSVTNLGIGSTSLPVFMFNTPSPNIADSFFVGYTANWSFAASNGDTIGILTTRDGYRYSPAYYPLGNGDTLINVKNATQYSDDTWNDDLFSNFQLANHLAIFPIVVVHYTTSAAGVTKNDFTFYGNYPNPATNSTNIKFALKNATEVSITVTDMTGKIIKNIQQNYAAGEHVVPVETSDLAAGSYLYLIRTSEGDGMGSKFTVVK